VRDVQECRYPCVTHHTARGCGVLVLSVTRRCWAPETAKRLAAYSRSLVVRAGVATCVATSPALLAPCGNLASEGLPNPERDGCGPPP
jgi:hypothetical protein